MHLRLHFAAKCLLFQCSARRALAFTRPRDFTQYAYSASMLKVW